MGDPSENAIEPVEEDDSWVFESLVNFLHGPIWKLPVMGFVEEKSVVFDPDSYNHMTEEKEEEYRKIHEEYKALVDFMLANFMEDIQVSPEKVEAACRIRETNPPHLESQITKLALEQIWAAEDFTTFRRLLTRKNIDLQLVTLELLVSKYGVLSPSLRNLDSEGGDSAGGAVGEDEFLKVVMRYTKLSSVLEGELNNSMKLRHEQKSNLKVEEESAAAAAAAQNLDCMSTANTLQLQNSAEFAQVPMPTSHPHPHPHVPDCTISTGPSLVTTTPTTNIFRQIDGHSLDLDENVASLPKKGNKQIETKNTNKKGKMPEKSLSGHGKTISTAAAVEVEAAAPVPELPQQLRLLQVKKALEMPEGGLLELEFDQLDSIPEAMMSLAIGDESGVSEEDIRRRRQYMRGQRDKLVEIKRKEREKQLEDESAGGGGVASKSRPKSSKAAKSYANQQKPVVPGPGNERSVAARRALANRLKQELNLQ